MRVIYDATSVEMKVRRWDATIRITRPDGSVTEIVVCAAGVGAHPGLWIGSPDEHEEH